VLQFPVGTRPCGHLPISEQTPLRGWRASHALFLFVRFFQTAHQIDYINKWRVLQGILRIRRRTASFACFLTAGKIYF
jgi:hypothetical protein